MPYWRNILEVAREERLQQARKDITAAPLDATQAMVARHIAGHESPVLSTDGLEVTEVTVLDISLDALQD
jgi:hypothetical protein